MEHPFLMFLDHTQWRSTVSRTPLDEWSGCRRDLYLTTHDTHNRQISMPPVGFEPQLSAGERPLTYIYDNSNLRVNHIFSGRLPLPLPSRNACSLCYCTPSPHFFCGHCSILFRDSREVELHLCYCWRCLFCVLIRMPAILTTTGTVCRGR